VNTEPLSELHVLEMCMTGTAFVNSIWLETVFKIYLVCVCFWIGVENNLNVRHKNINLLQVIANVQENVLMLEHECVSTAV